MYVVMPRMVRRKAEIWKRKREQRKVSEEAMAFSVLKLICKDDIPVINGQNDRKE